METEEITQEEQELDEELGDTLVEELAEDTDTEETTEQTETTEPDTQPTQQRQPLFTPEQFRAGTDALLQRGQDLFDEEQLQWIQQYTAAVAQQAQLAAAAEEAHYAELGLSADFVRQYKADLAIGKTIVPEHLQGTKEGTMLAITAALFKRMAETGDVTGELEQALKALKSEKPNNTTPRSQRTRPKATTPPGRSGIPDTTRKKSFLAEHFGLTTAEIRRYLGE